MLILNKGDLISVEGHGIFEVDDLWLGRPNEHMLLKDGCISVLDLNRECNRDSVKVLYRV